MADISKVLVGESEHDIKDTTARAVMTGATSSTAGTAGRVPAPSAGDNEKFLRGDGTWHDVDTAPTYTFDTVAEMNAAIQAGTVPANGAVVYCKEDVPMGNEGDTSLDTTSTNWVQNQAVATAVNGKADHAVIAAVDNASTASKAFTKGEYIYHNGVLYTAYRDISQGDTFVAQGEGGEYNLIEAVIGDDLYTVTVNVAPIESSYFTSKEYYKGQYFWWQGKLYKATAFISRGTNISSANKEATTVDSELYALNTSLAQQGYLEVTIQSIAVGTYTTSSGITNIDKITSDMACVYFESSNAAAYLDINIATGNQQITVTGTIVGTTNLKMRFIKQRTS